MPRVTKECFTWHVTWSPEEDVKELPEYIFNFLRSDAVRQCYAIAERHDTNSKWHIHVGLRYYRSYKSDYKWWKPELERNGFKEPALEFKYHDNLLGLVGGYCSKDKDRIVLYNKGFSDEELSEGANIYKRGITKQQIRGFLDKFTVINREKIDVASGAMQSKLGVGKEESLIELAEHGFAFATSSGKGFDTIYKEMFSVHLAAADNMES